LIGSIHEAIVAATGRSDRRGDRRRVYTTGDRRGSRRRSLRQSRRRSPRVYAL